VLDPFAGVATTLVEGLKAGCNVVGYEINGFAAMAGGAKINCIDVPPAGVRSEVDAFRTAMQRYESEVDRLCSEGDSAPLAEQLCELRQVAPPRFRSRIPFFSPPVEAKFLYALKRVESLLEPDRSLFRTALGATMVSYSNYTYEPSLGSRPGAGKPLIANASVGLAVGRKLEEMLDDIAWARDLYGSTWRARERRMHHASYFDSQLGDQRVDLLITSPPYMNNYHYVRNTRPQLYWLGLVTGPRDLQRLERESFGKFWQTVRQGPRVELACDFPELRRTLEELRTIAVDKGHYGGAGWANYVATYFNDSVRLLEQVARQLRPGAHAVIVVGNSIIQGIEFKVDHLLAQLAERQGLSVEEISIVRTKRVGTSIIDSAFRNGEGNSYKSRTQLYDAAVILRA
jgi:DNA modification methylase